MGSEQRAVGGRVPSPFSTLRAQAGLNAWSASIAASEPCIHVTRSPLAPPRDDA